MWYGPWRLALLLQLAGQRWVAAKCGEGLRSLAQSSWNVSQQVGREKRQGGKHRSQGTQVGSDPKNINISKQLTGFQRCRYGRTACTGQLPCDPQRPTAWQAPIPGA